MFLDLQEMEFAAARRRLNALIRRGVATPKDHELLADLPKFERARAELDDSAFRSSPRGLLLNAQLRLRIGRFDEALPLWERVLDTQGAGQASEALRQLVAFGNLEQMKHAVASFQERFGPLPDALANAYAVRRADVEAALQAKKELGI